jgi:hypothetical protein
MRHAQAGQNQLQPAPVDVGSAGIDQQQGRNPSRMVTGQLKRDEPPMEWPTIVAFARRK